MTFENCKLSNRKLISIEQTEDHKTKKSYFKKLKGLEHCSTQDNVWALKARVKCKNSSYTIFSKDRAMSIDTRYRHISIPVPHARIFSIGGSEWWALTARPWRPAAIGESWAYGGSWWRAAGGHCCWLHLPFGRVCIPEDTVDGCEQEISVRKYPRCVK